MRQPYRLATGGRIDRSRGCRFIFDGTAYEGHPGDSLASALLANGIHLVGRSFKYHRPRGIFSAGAEEPNALLQLGLGRRSTPNQRATLVELTDGLVAASQNCWPSVRIDLGRVSDHLSPLFPAGFYYKTFLGPPSRWKKYEWFIRRAAGLGRAPDGPDPDRYEKVNEHCDVLVAGAGPAGLAAALAAAASGARVLIADEHTEPGGQLLGTQASLDGKPAQDWVTAATDALDRHANVTRLARATVVGYYDHNFLTIAERLEEGQENGHPRERLWRVRAKQVVLATGAIERPLAFADNDRPGILLASAARTYVNRFAVRPGNRAVIFTNNDDAYLTALDLAGAGVEVAAVVDTRPEPQGASAVAVLKQSIPLLAGYAVIQTEGGRRLRSLEVARLTEAGDGVTTDRRQLDCDLLAVSGGWNPTVHLYSQSGGKTRFDPALAAFVPDRSAQAERSAGAAAGTLSLGDCLAQGAKAGAEAARAAGYAEGGIPPLPRSDEPASSPARHLWVMPRQAGKGGKRFIDLHNDVTDADLKLATSEGYRSVEHVKRYTTLGMGPDQGKTSNVLALSVLSEALGAAIPAIGTTTFRPPYMPVSFGTMAGRNVGALADPLRVTPMDSWQAATGAVFEPVGQWRRARFYPKPGEDMQRAVDREVLAARNGVGLFDASTLGKIDARGPDAAEFLDRVYCNDFKSLAVGRCRYGLMLGEDGMVRDDGVTARIGPDQFHMTTTTGGAAPILHWLEEWRQCEWPTLRVHLTSVTEQWAVAALVGPKARDVLAGLVDFDISAGAFAFMQWRSGRVAGIPARVFRVSFTGDLSFEINVPARHGRALWEALLAAGAADGITPYGTEALHVLRAEKGFIVVGHETDGSVTPIDLGLEAMLSKKKDFIGKRSLARPLMRDPGRKQLVGLTTADAKEYLPEGAQIVDRPPGTERPVPMIGHVSSSYRSATLGRSIAMALIKGGRARLGSTVFVPLMDGRVVAAEITSPVFYDVEGKRRDG
ncbi:MAG: sarcosine oxidase subunit alpha family protein [Proteobacteria bacterium]|nr:sarcosine oxidase subunit alpha family protein [Pseudomonadota bacterium]MBI3497265.1 sarcosine oxidase subunit alpha family protein [Pseudomonadota bacterium]